MSTSLELGYQVGHWVASMALPTLIVTVSNGLIVKVDRAGHFRSLCCHRFYLMAK
jgi:hypothetical protein